MAVSEQDEAERAAAFRAQQARRATYERKRRLDLAGNKAARRQLTENWAAFSGTVRLPAPPTMQE